MANIADDRLLGRYDEGDAGAPIALTASSVRALLNVADGATANTGDITGVTAGTNCSGGGSSGSVTINVDDAFLINSGDDTTSGTITAGGFTTTGTWTFDDATSGTVGITTIHTGSSFTDNDTSLMTAGAIKEKIESYGYTTADGDITSVRFVTDSGSGASAEDTAGTANFSLLGSSGVGITNSGTTITAVAVPAEIDHDSLSNFVANEHIDWTGASAGTIHSTNYSNTNQLTTFVVEDGDGTEVTISQDKEWKFVEGTGIDIDWTDTSNGSDADPYDLTITCDLEGTELKSTGETGGTKFLREDGDGTCSWQTVSGGGGASALNDLSDVTYSSGDLTISSLDKIISGNLDFDSSGHINFDGCSAGFTRTTYADATNVTVDFRTGNKAHLDMTGGSISGTLTMQFPAVSGNFVLVVQQDGSTRTIANYATKDSAGNAGANDGGTAGAVRWSGGSVPDLTDGGNKRDVLSFYWDATEEVCYGVASLNF